jgi:hypothetical protein
MMSCERCSRPATAVISRSAGDTAIIRLFTDTGMRCSELANLRVDELDLDLSVEVVSARAPVSDERASGPMPPDGERASARLAPPGRLPLWGQGTPWVNRPPGGSTEGRPPAHTRETLRV